jgi:hypothetical protein
VVAWLRCKVDQAQQGLLAMPNSPYHSMDVPALAAYAAGQAGRPPLTACLPAAEPQCTPA